MSSEVSQERLDLKPCCRSVRILCFSRCLWIDVYIICSRIVHGILVREMVLSFFLWIGTVCAFNQSEGGVPEFIDFWNMIVRMGAILEAISFRILAGMLSGPWALFGFNSLSNFSMPLTVVWIGGICEVRFWLGSFRFAVCVKDSFIF